MSQNTSSKQIIYIESNNKSDASSKRILATMIDWLIGGIICNLPAVLAYAYLDKKSSLTNLYQLEAIGYSRSDILLILFLCIILTFFYFVIIPWKFFPGQTIGKRIMKLKILKQDGKRLTFIDYVTREFVFLNLIEGSAVSTSNFFRVFLTTTTKIYLDDILNIIWFIMTFISATLLFVRNDHLCLHDRFTKSIVVRTTKKDIKNAE